ncbi:MAG TPA: PAS domain-containing protein, partial [Deinococcales bacterium]|nr:PAS domain-containing protein [Deinococcales bacterium]
MPCPPESSLPALSGPARGSLPAAWRALDALPVMAWLADAQGQPIAFNATFAAYAGRSPAELLAGGPAGYAHPDDLENVNRWRSALAGGDAAATLAVRLRAADGSHRWFSGTAGRLPGAGEGGAVFVAVLSDVTEARAGREALEGQRRLQDAILKHMPGGLVFTDPDDRLLLVNDAFRDLMGGPPPGSEAGRP